MSIFKQFLTSLEISQHLASPHPLPHFKTICAHVFHHQEHLSSSLILMQQIFTLATKYFSGTDFQALS